MILVLHAKLLNPNEQRELFLTCERVLDHETNFFDVIFLSGSCIYSLLIPKYCWISSLVLWSFICSVAEDLRDDRKSVEHMII